MYIESLKKETENILNISETIALCVKNSNSMLTHTYDYKIY